MKTLFRYDLEMQSQKQLHIEATQSKDKAFDNSILAGSQPTSKGLGRTKENH